jgi:hypothetical protein
VPPSRSVSAYMRKSARSSQRHLMLQHPSRHTLAKDHRIRLPTVCNLCHSPSSFGSPVLHSGFLSSLQSLTGATIVGTSSRLVRGMELFRAGEALHPLPISTLLTFMHFHRQLVAIYTQGVRGNVQHTVRDRATGLAQWHDALAKGIVRVLKP